MSDENNLNNEELNEASNTAVEEASGDVMEKTEAAAEAEAEAEAAAEAAEETAAETVEAAEEDTEAEVNQAVAEAKEAFNSVSDESNKKSKAVPIIIAAVIVVIVAALVVLGIKFGPSMFNKYNRMGYIDTSGRTVEEVADSSGMDLAQFLEEYSLPSDMPGNTAESVAYYMIPCSKMAEMYGMDFATMKSTLEWPDTITEETTWGEAEGETKISVYVGDDNLQSFKEYYGLGDEVTGDTLWKEIRNVVDEKNREERIAAEKAAEESTSDTGAVTDDTAATDGGDTATTEDAPAAEGDTAADTSSEGTADTAQSDAANTEASAQ